ncbi:328_t:CDS:2 [Entrophospora sp. SA101]|nr:15868_t:CDS:2 [Entrophospora sp. SA101]CAJ0849613.1 328_t:CDS:2 [Entrophospora sp. SA101]
MSGKEIGIIILFIIYLGGATISGVWQLLGWIYRSYYYAEPSTENIRNILIVRRTGSGKSALANVLLGKEKFTEVGGSISGTKNKEKCKEDREKLLAENKDIAEIIRDFNIIHVNNPPPGYGYMVGKAREHSRQKLLNHLKCL